MILSEHDLSKEDESKLISRRTNLFGEIQMTANLQMNYRATLSTTVTSFRAAVLMKNKSLT